jgi:hypothetical protein
MIPALNRSWRQFIGAISSQSGLNGGDHWRRTWNGPTQYGLKCITHFLFPCCLTHLITYVDIHKLRKIIRGHFTCPVLGDTNTYTHMVAQTLVCVVCLYVHVYDYTDAWLWLTLYFHLYTVTHWLIGPTRWLLWNYNVNGRFEFQLFYEGLQQLFYYTF